MNINRRHFIIACFAIITLLFFAGCIKAHKGHMPLGENAPILLFNGTGSSDNDVEAFETLMDENGFFYSTASSKELNAMNAQQLLKYKLLIVPGGNFIEMAKHITDSTAANIHKAVQQGLNYHGICAGGFLAGCSKYYNSFNLTQGVAFGFYAVSARGVRKEAVTLTYPDKAVLEHYWEDGPQFTGWGFVIAKYPDATPAIVEGASGKGCVILSGVHAEAPENWRTGMVFNTTTTANNAYAVKLISAALSGVALANF